MSAPSSLTSTPPARLNWSDNGEPVAQDFDDIYFSVDGGLAETKTVFLDGCGLPEAWQDRDVFVIGELGFGSGLNFLAAWELWQSTHKPGQRLHFISVEAYPLDKEQLARALENFPTLKPLADRLVAGWPGPVKGVHRLHLDTVTLTLFHSNVEQALANMDAQIDAWFLDGFSPAKNPDMWREHVFAYLEKLSAPNASLATFTVAGHVRRGLEAAGFAVKKEPGFGRKRERLQARLKEGQGAYVQPKGAYVQPKGSYVQPKGSRIRPIDIPVIIGGGIAGAAISHGFIRRGITPLLIEPHPELDTAASGNPAGLMMPKLDLQDRPESRFYNAGFLYAKSLYHKHGAVLDRGILHLASSDKEKQRFEKIADNQALPVTEMRLVDGGEANNILGVNMTPGFGGLYFEGALVLSPKLSAQALSAPAIKIKARVHTITKIEHVWHILDADGQCLAKTKALFLCNGANILDLWPANVRFTRGQICWSETAAPPKRAHILGNYASPFKGGIVLGATHTHVSPGEDNKTHAKDSAKIIKHYGATTNTVLDENGWSARASVRVTTRDTLPVAEQVDGGLFVLSGLGSRGLMLAPLLGEALVCKALGEPSPLDTRTQKRFEQSIKT